MLKWASSILLSLSLLGCGGVNLTQTVGTLVQPFTDFSEWESGSPSSQTTRPESTVKTSFSSKPGENNAESEVIRPANPDVIIPGQDPLPEAIKPAVNLTIYQYIVPVGAISSDDEFWKRVDEGAINVKTHDILDRNGMRVGLAPFVDWPKISQRFIKLDPKSKPVIYTAPGTKNPEIVMKKEVISQIIYHFTPDGRMPVRSYDDSTNILRLEFGPAPRKAGDLRIELCPMIRSLRKTILSTGETITFVSPEAFFDLSLLTDVPLDSMLIIAPSRQAKESMSLGKAFFIDQTETAQTETILLLVPQAIKE